MSSLEAFLEQRKVILIVEDDPKSLTLTRDLLQISGYTTIEATDGEKGVELAKAKNRTLS